MRLVCIRKPSKAKKEEDYLRFNMIEITVLDPTACRLGFDVASVDFTWMAYVVIVPVMRNNWQWTQNHLVYTNLFKVECEASYPNLYILISLDRSFQNHYWYIPSFTINRLAKQTTLLLDTFYDVCSHERFTRKINCIQLSSLKKRKKMTERKS